MRRSELHKGGCIIQCIWHGAILSPALAMMDTDRNVFFSTLWEWKMENEHALVCSTGHVIARPNSSPPLSYANFCQSPFSACVQGCHKQWASVIQPPFQVCFHCPGLQVSAGGLHSQRHHQTEGYLACTLLCQHFQYTAHSFPQPNGIKMDLKFLAVPACIFLFEHMHAHYSNISSHIRPCRSLRNTSAASSSQQGISVTGRTILNLLLSLCDFPISGRHLPFGARQSGIWEGKMLLWPKAQQCVSFDQWVSFGF